MYILVGNTKKTIRTISSCPNCCQNVHNLGVISEHRFRILDELTFVWREGDQRVLSGIGRRFFMLQTFISLSMFANFHLDGGLKQGEVFI